MKDWLDRFYGSTAFRATLITAFGPLFLRYARDITGATEENGGFARDFATSLAASYVDHHLNSSRAQLQEVLDGADGNELAALTTRLDEWTETRAAKVAANETLRAANAVAVQQFKDAGVERKVWSASGGNVCPFCASLDGMTVEVTKPFVEEGDELNPPGAETAMVFESSIGHPPIHQGCDCSVVAG